MPENNDSLFSNRRYAFSVDGLSPQSFEVVRFDGEEAMSTLYRFDLLLASTDSDIDEGALITQTAQFSLNDGVEGGHPTVYRGLVQSFIYQYQISGWTFYRATLTPKLWLLDTFYLSEIYLEKTRPEIFLTIMSNAGFTFDDVDVRFLEIPDHPRREFICQYQESYLTFIARWTERVGIYWWFEDVDGKEKVVFCNNRMGHREEALLLHYRPPGELDALIGKQRRIQSLELEARNLPKTIVIRDYNEQRAGMAIMGTTTVDPNGSGEVHIFGEHLQNNDEAAQFVALRAEGFRCRKHIYRGSSTATGLRCGEFMTVQGHPRSRFNQRYLVTGVRHRGSQSGLLLEGLSVPVEIDANRSGDFYLAEITAIPANVQFRPEITHPWPKIEGTMTGFIDAEGSGKYAELNENGEYKVQLPYDITEKSAKKASAWIRMASPYAGVDDGGSGHGMHFPLHKGAEVLLSFRNGNPDKPVIIGAVTNSITPNMVTNENQTQSVIHTAGGNSLEFHDEEGRQGIHFFSPVADTQFSLGAPLLSAGSVSAAASSNSTTTEGIHFETDGSFTIAAMDVLSNVGGSSTINVAGAATTLTEGAFTLATLGLTTNAAIGGNINFSLAYNFIQNIGPAYEYNATAKYRIAPVAVNATVSQIDAVTTKLKNTVTDVNTALNTINSNVNKVVTDVTNVNNAVTKMQDTATSVKNEGTGITSCLSRIFTSATHVANSAAKVSVTASEVKTNVVSSTSGVQIFMP
ncbi:type VI secretion system tip protein VgrG [Candidatus Methylospira mobilis]|uniref:Type VI secretion system tip protein VgrG n=1 Tax=Candidatus Methylospira mobilis TaxID=1808979 RepID=A0A5Q0BDT8_9GAMM|nr:type VI secretion system tip protein TssI/VgrG [Candidatus Methylospira mobilis]QFY41699.1 type VI secretion system tip protein VgrG [Candidatus Methylospira mobilis]